MQNGLVLRLSVPASGELSNLGPELAARLAEQLGVKSPQASQVAAAITDLSTKVQSSESAAVEFEFHKHGAQLKILARCEERTAETRLPLSA